MSKVLVVQQGRAIGSSIIEVPELDEVVQPRRIVDAVDGAIGYLEEMVPESYLVAEADDGALFSVTHDAFGGQIATREEFHYFNAWLEREVIVNPAILATLDDMIPRIVRVIH